MTRRIRVGFVGLALLVVASCGEKNQPSIEAQENASTQLSVKQSKLFSVLTVKEIMQGPGLIGTSPTRPSFSADGFTVYFHWNDPARLDSLNAAQI